MTDASGVAVATEGMGVALYGVLAASLTLTALAATAAPRHRLLALACSATAMFALPWVAGPVPLVRGVFALVQFVSAFRVIDLVRSREPWDARRRILHALSLIDSRLLRRARPRLEVVAVVAALTWGGLAALALRVARDLPARCAVNPLWLRLGGGVVFAYAAIEAGYAMIRAGYRAAGFVTPPLHIWPLASMSVGELWGMRWARPVSRWLRETCFLPLARRGHPTLGVLVGFVVSAFGHAYPVLVASGPAAAMMMFGYFTVQGVVVVAETRVGIAKWPRAWRRSWTITIMLATSPLFVVPCLRVVIGDSDPRRPPHMHVSVHPSSPAQLDSMLFTTASGAGQVACQGEDDARGHPRENQ
jgi:hypothetical protein